MAEEEKSEEVFKVDTGEEPDEVKIEEDDDGVVLDTEPLYTKAEVRLFREYGVELPEEDWSLFRGCSENDFFDFTQNL